VFAINKTPIIKVAFVKNPAGPFEPNTDSLLPLYAPSPMDELFCNKTAIVKSIAKINCIAMAKLIIF
jgi:hypothetical protein